MPARSCATGCSARRRWMRSAARSTRSSWRPADARDGGPAGRGRPAALRDSAAMATLNVHLFGPADAPAVLAIHGITGHGGRFARTAREGLPERRVVAVDLRGH